VPRHANLLFGKDLDQLELSLDFIYIAPSAFSNQSIMDIICFFAGTAFFYYRSIYPLLLLIIALIFRPKLSYLFLFLIAITLSALHEHLIRGYNMPTASILRQAELEGYIHSIPSQNAHKTQFQFLLEKLNGRPAKTNLLLSCYQHCPRFHVGQHLRLKANLKRPRNFLNPGAFDYVAYLAARHVQWQGTIYPQSIQPLNSIQKHYFLSQLREHYDKVLTQLDSDEKTLGIIEALSIGLTHHIDKTQWDLFRRTGTTHLIDISGEHIALVAGFFYFLFSVLWKTSTRCCLYLPAPKIASAAAIVLSFCYALISGFAVPTQRAFITCSLFFGRHFAKQRITAWQAWRYALLLVLLLEPHSVFMLGFYFSFIAVSLLILTSQRVQGAHYRQLLALQLACLIGLLPLSLYWFSYASINGFFANLIAIPWVGALIVPLTLIVVLLSPYVVIPGSIYLLKLLIYSLLTFLQWIDSFSNFNLCMPLPVAYLPFALMLGFYVVFFLPLKRLIPATCLMLLGCLFPRQETVKPGEVVIDVLDVGQGLACVIRSSHHTLIYDTGMRFHQGTDMAKLVILPYLQRLNVKHVDKIIISHHDLDHRGGLESLASQYPQHELIVDQPSFYHRGHSCHHHPTWSWDGVQFRFFAISKELPGKNNHSCVLQIASGGKKILLPGDIETKAEAYLLANYADDLRSTILLLPHHGSKTSSSLAFIHAVHPEQAIVSYGLDNPYHLPHPQSLQRYQALRIPLYSTAKTGMVRVQLSNTATSLVSFLPKIH
jgi:competence protein ComEC